MEAIQEDKVFFQALGHGSLELAFKADATADVVLQICMKKIGPCLFPFVASHSSEINQKETRHVANNV